MKNLFICINFLLGLKTFTCDTSNESCHKDGCPSKVDLQKFNQEDVRLIENIRKQFLIQPPNPIRPKPSLDVINGPKDQFNLRAQYGQPIAIEDLFYGSGAPLFEENAGQRFFIEAGAFDGAFLSNSLYLEMKHNWTGLLVEPNPDYFKTMADRGRNSWLLPACFSTTSMPTIVQFDAAGLLGGIENTDDPSKKKPGDESPDQVDVHRRTIESKCLPFFSVISALENPRIDYLSLDVEGSELQILKTIPWDKVDISVLGIEVNHLDEVFSGKLEDLRNFLSDKGYKIYQTVSIDEIYVKKSLLKRLASSQI